MEAVDELARAAGGGDPVAGLAAVTALRRLLEELEAAHVVNARAQGVSWETIAGALGVKRQSAHRKHAHRIFDGGS
ncbi:helix-turn-helix domain-containing protein [Planomonospora sp. ID67723]|uniref:helix-turn-helix domain-containing protein n=1 Tax=Planomonospora sp. ID67723 TaxID=2738134 RepID=UPI0018C43934|nr:helix-turn-helix domain-containing protein [Planomonospora sp. ID67723]MBG0833201.1 helix-turn-helix domain-containing protein [Planomonospora sp. ID67723]